jgi:hypothetical protein
MHRSLLEGDNEPLTPGGRYFIPEKAAVIKTISKDGRARMEFHQP